MLTKLKLMLIKDLKSTIRARWYILLIEIVLTLIFVPIIWYSLSSTDKDSNEQFVEDYINKFINDSNYGFGRLPKVIYYKSDSGVDVSLIENVLKNNSINFLENSNNRLVPYAHLFSLSYQPPSINFSVVYPTLSYSDINYKFTPSIFGCDFICGVPFVNDPFMLDTHYYITSAFLTATNSSRIPFTPIVLNEIPSARYKNSNFSDAMDIWHTILALVMFIPLVFSIKDVTIEKENQIHVYMIVMGMKRYAYYISHFIFATFKMYAVVLLAGLAFVVYIKNGWWYYLNLIAFGHVTVAWAMLASTIFVSGTYAMICAFAFLGISMLLHFLVIDPYADIYVAGGAIVGSLLNPFSAYTYAKTHTQIALNYDVPFRMFNSWPYYLPMIVPLISLILQAIFYTLLTFYFDYVLPIDSSVKAHPLFFLGVKSKKETMHEDDFEDISDKKNAKYMDYFEPDTQGIADIEILNLIKKWPNGELAVKSACFKAYRGQVTALLGHNGAGKSTIFGCLTGFIKPTLGQIIIGEEAESSKIGYCPQWDPLFPLLTVEEHLYFYGNLKTDLPILPQEVNEVLEQINLVEAKNIRGNALSGGMKRKLCVGMAMVGRSRIMLLDEPTAGMDPMARRGVLDIVEKVKTNKTVLLTTHYMDEADLLSDKIIIMAKGELICNGSSNFLKSKFGVGFVLTISTDTRQCGPEEYDSVAESIMKVVTTHCEGAKIDGHGAAQLKIILPHGSQREFSSLFSELEAKKRQLKLDSFGVGVNNLEQVFIKVTDMADPEGDIGTKGKIESFLNLRNNRSHGLMLFLQQCFGLFLRKLHFIRRHYFKTLIPLAVLIPLLGLCIENAVSSNQDKTNQNQIQELNLKKYPQFLVMSAWYQSTPITHAIDTVINNWSKLHYKQIPYDNYRQTLFDAQLNLPPLGFGFSLNKNNIFSLYYREVLSGSGALAIKAFSEAITTTSVSINVFYDQEKIKLSDLDLDDDLDDAVDSIYRVIIAYLSSLIYPIIFGIPIFLYIAEFHNGARHLYRLTQLSQFTYWLMAYITDMLIGIFYIFLILAMLFGFQVFKIKCLPAYFVSILAISFPLLSQAYVVTFLFASPNMAFGVLNAYNILVASMSFGLVDVFPKNSRSTYTIITDILFPFKSMIMVTQTMVSECMPDFDNDAQPGSYPTGAARVFATCYDDNRPCSGWSIYGSLIMGSIYLLVLILMTNWRTIKLRIRPKKSTPSFMSNEDADVSAERELVDSSPVNKFSISTHHLRKRYNNNIVAVQDLTFGVLSGECFGILGVNGAGKSTTFHMLTGVLTPSAGSGYVNGVRIDGQAKFGFCPQHNAVLEDLTVMETMLLFARLNGLSNIQECVNILLEILQISHRTNNVVKNCSGGERRRLSIAVALITNCEVIMLDEPTAGVDPRTRRHVWDILIAMRKGGTSQILSSHSMEECEALCTRIGFLNRGELLGIGTSQHLKHRFGDKFILTLTLSAPAVAILESLDEFVRQIFPSATRSLGFLATSVVWSLPKTQVDLWSKIYHSLILLVDNWNFRHSECRIEDFSLIESSLEQVFISMARVPISMEV